LTRDGFGDQVFWLDPPEAARLSRIKTEKMAQIRRAEGDALERNWLEIGFCPDGRQGCDPLPAIFGPGRHQNRLGL
jgi:hypothetical protein